MTNRRGFTLLEILAVLAVIAALSAVLLTVAVGRMGAGRTAALAGTMDSLARGMTGFRGDVRRYPSRLTDLGVPITAGAVDVCGNAIAAPLIARWRGPYVDRQIPAGGLPSGAANIRNDLERDPATAGPDEYGLLLIVVEGVDQGIAETLLETLDGDGGDFASGTIRWVGPDATGQGTLRYAIPIRGC